MYDPHHSARTTRAQIAATAPHGVAHPAGTCWPMTAVPDARELWRARGGGTPFQPDRNLRSIHRMNPHPTTQELFDGNTVALHDPDLDVFIAKGHHDPAELAELLRTGEGVPPLLRDCLVAPGAVTQSWAVFAWHKPRCDAVGEDRPWCQCGLDESGARVDWYPTPADLATPQAVPVTWFRGTL
jgi:hypothetical protein